MGTSQRFGVPFGLRRALGAGYLAARESHKRALPGRLVGVLGSTVQGGQPLGWHYVNSRANNILLRKATSNICTAQVLLAVIASRAVWHGPDGLRAIATGVSTT